MSIIIPLLYFILANTFVTIITKKTFGKCLPMTLMINAIIMYLSQILFKTFKVGYIINLLLPLFAIILLIYKKLKTKEFNDIKSNIFSSGFYTFLIIYIFIVIFDLNRGVSVWDEFSHWGVMVKEMFRLNKFYFDSASTLMVHQDYPPIIQIFEMFYAKLSGGFNEAYLYRGLHLLMFSLFIPSLTEISKKTSKKKIILLSLTVIINSLLLILSFDQHGIVTALYIDYIMAITVAYILAIIVENKDTKNLFVLSNLMISFIFLLLTKQIAITLYLMILFMYVVDIFIKNNYKIKNLFTKKNLLKTITIIIMLIVIPFSSLKLWNINIDKLNIEQQFSTKDLKIMELPNIIKSDSYGYQHDAAVNYLKEIRTYNLSTIALPLTYIQCIVLFCLIMYIISKLGKKIFYKEQIPLAIITLLIGYLGYAFVMLVMYTFSFGPIEGPSLASMDRYLDTFIITSIIFAYMLFIYIDKDIKKHIILFAILILLQNPECIFRIFPKVLYIKNDYEVIADEIKDKIEDNKKVYIVAQDTAGEYPYYLKYYLDTSTTNTIKYEFDLDQENYEEYFNNNINNYMLEFDYVYLAKVDLEFMEAYKFLSDDKIDNKGLYKINNREGKVKLKKIN